MYPSSVKYFIHLLLSMEKLITCHTGYGEDNKTTRLFILYLVKMATKQNGDKPKWRQTKIATTKNGDKRKRRKKRQQIKNSDKTIRRQSKWGHTNIAFRK